MAMTPNWKTITMSLVTATALVACNTDLGGTGKLSLNITDAPVDTASKVSVKFTGITLKHENSSPERHDFDEPREIDLLALQGEAFEELLTNQSVSSGRYQWIRLHVVTDRHTTDSYIEINDSQYPLHVPSGSASGLQLSGGFDVPDDGEASFTIDFDLRKSLVDPQNGEHYFLKPALRLVDNSQIGHIRGTVDENLYCEGEGNAVYVFDGHDANLIDINTERDENPVTTANVSHGGEAYTFSVGFLTAGDYTLAFTCDAGDDDPEDDDNLEFSTTLNTSVTAGETTQVTFELSND